MQCVVYALHTDILNTTQIQHTLHTHHINLNHKNCNKTLNNNNKCLLPAANRFM